jgi:hypothetical protein
MDDEKKPEPEKKDDKRPGESNLQYIVRKKREELERQDKKEDNQ